jgi:hypothetical protein
VVSGAAAVCVNEDVRVERDHPLAQLPQFAKRPRPFPG